MYTNCAEAEQELQARLEYGTVLRTQANNSFVVAATDGELACEQAVSCIVRPQPGDRVLISQDQEEGSYILAVLSHGTSRQGTDIEFRGDVRVRVREGSLSLAAEDKLECSGEHYAVYAQNGEIAVARLSVLGRVIQWQAKKILAVAENVEHVFHSLTQRLRESQRYVEEHEDVQCGSARHLVEETLTMQAKNINHMAEEVVKVDGEQVHLG